MSRTKRTPDETQTRITDPHHDCTEHVRWTSREHLPATSFMEAMLIKSGYCRECDARVRTTWTMDDVMVIDDGGA